jgi:ABC-type dipeptide/oligopeptide/nickel transport system permease component
LGRSWGVRPDRRRDRLAALDAGRRLVRAQFLSLREKEFVEAARALGVPTARQVAATSCRTRSGR